MSIEHISRIGGHVVLDFMNTVGNHLGDHPSDWLATYADLVIWSRNAGLITADEAEALTQRSNRHPEEAVAALVRAAALREALYRLLLCVIRGQTPAEADLAILNQTLAEAPVRTQIIPHDDHYHWHLPYEVTSLDHILWRLAWSAGDLLTSAQLAQVKVCEGDECGWVFLDTSRNQARRWCSMADCGNRAKANRFYKRHKSE